MSHPGDQQGPAPSALFKVGGDRAACTGCGACTRVPMGIEVDSHVAQGRRVISECILCVDCANAWPEGILDATYAWGDVAPTSRRVAGSDV